MKAIEDFSDRFGIPDRSEHLSRSPAPWTGQHVDFKDPSHEFGPEEVAARRGRLAASIFQRTFGRRLGNDLRSPLGVRGEHAVIEDEVDARRRDQSGEFFNEGQWIEKQKSRAVGVGRFDLIEDSPVGQLGKPVIGDRGPSDITAKSFEPVAVAGGDAKSCVQGKALYLSAMFLIRREMDSEPPLAQAGDPGSPFWAESDLSLNGSGVTRFEKVVGFAGCGG